MKKIWSVVKSKVLKYSIYFILLSLLLGIIKFIVPSKSVNAGSGSWAIGGDGIIAPLDPSRHSGSGATAWTLGSTFLVHLQQLDTFALTKGRDKMIKEVDSKVTRYMIDSIALIPYELVEDLEKKNYNTVAVIKRPTADSTDIAYRSSKGYLNAVVKLDKKVTEKTNTFKKGVFYDEIKDKSNEELLDNWKKLVKGKENKSMEVWSYITAKDGNRYRIAERIDEYLHIKELDIDSNNMAKADPDSVKELKMRYTDLLMTLYSMIDGSYAQPAWETAIEEYIKGISDKKQNRSNICITPGVMARGIMNTRNGKTKTENIIAGVHDLLDMTIVTEPQYSLGALRTADTVEKSLEKKGKSNTYYNRLLESIRLSLVYQSKNNIDVERTYSSAGLFGSNIVSRLIKNKPIINGTKVSYQTSRQWSDQKLIENINLKEGYHGQIIVPAYTGVEEPSYKATLNVGSTKEGFIDKRRVDVKDDTVLNDAPKLTINLDWQTDKEKWEMLFKGNKYYKVQVEFTRKPDNPNISLEPKSYINPPELISKDKLKAILQGEVELHNWLDNSINKVPIEENETIEYTYQAKVIIYYSNSSRDIEKMNKIEKATNKAKITYLKSLTNMFNSGDENEEDTILKNGFYISEPDAYAELKEGTVYNETFEAMAGVPTTRRLYFGAGGSEFMVEVEVLYDPDKTAERTYRSYFASTDCEFKKGDTAPNMTLGGQSVSIHGGGTYSKTWTGSIPNLATAQTALHNATCTAIPDFTEYNAKKAEAQAFAAQVNSTVLSFTSASDKKTRSFSDWKAAITSDSQTLPQTTHASVPCEKKPAVTHEETIDNGDGTTSTITVIDVPAVPCQNEMATANPGPAGSFTITVTWTVPAHVLCGPCCSHILPSVEDTWTQKSTFDTLKIVDVRVWKIHNGYVEGMEDITYDEDAFVKATIKQGDPNIFYNIAGADTSQEGRLRYSLQQQQHDAVTWYERNSSGSESRSNKCDGLSGTLCPQNPIPVAPNQGHNNSWAKGILYNNPDYPNKVDHHKTNIGTKSTTTNNSTDSIDKQTEEYKRFDERRKMDNTITVISDMLILQTSSGDQSVVYFETSQTKNSQENFDDIQVSFEQMWTNNGLSAASWKEDHINVGSYNGKFYDPSNKYEGTGNYSTIATAFDHDAAKVSSGDELNKARVVSTKSFGNVSGNKSSPSKGEARLTRPSRLRIYQDNIRQNPVNPNGEYFTGQSYVYYKEILSYTDDTNASGIANAHEDELEVNTLGDFGYTIKSRYRLYDNKHGNINSIVVHNPVSVSDARIVSLPKEMDQRTTIPEGSADTLLDEIAALEVCPLSPSLCEFRELNCQYYQESVKASFDFEKVSTLRVLDDNYTSSEDITDGELGTGQLVFDNFETNDYGITAINNCSLDTSEERLVINITGKDAEIELPVDINASSIVAAKVHYGTSGMSTSSRLYWEGSNSSSLTTSIKPASINETMIFNLINSQDWKQADKISKIRFQFDGDNTGSGMYIISKIEFIEEGDYDLEDGIIVGSEDDKTIIRNLIKTAAGTYLDYSLPNGFSISDKEGTFDSFGTGRFLNVNGTRLSMGLDEIGLVYDEHTRVKVEANIFIPNIVSKDRMLFSFNGMGFFIPAGQTYGAFTTGSGVEKKVNYNFINKTLKLGVVFSFGDIDDCEVYINDNKLTNITTIKPSADITDFIIGDSVNIGCWNINQNYVTGFYLDNLKISRMPGTSEHTAACYTVYKEHHYSKYYTCDYSTYDFPYTGKVQTFTAPASGYYLLEAWGASGGGENSAGLGNPGKGGYSASKVFLNKGEKLYVYVGEKGADSYSPNYLKGTFNGGGAGMDTGLLADGHQGGQGGGATDFRKVGGAWDDLTGLLTRILVAGGGGGAGCASNLDPGGDGGGLEGVTTWNKSSHYPGYQASGGTQTSGGKGMRYNEDLTGVYTRSGGFGYGAPGAQCGAGGGGGWYGGGSGYTAGGGGGSSYIDGVSEGMTLTGIHSGHGKAKITLLGHTHNSECTYEITENNSHVHTSDCINENSTELVNALKLAEKGDFSYIKELLGDSVYNKLPKNKIKMEYDAHIHTQDCRYTPATETWNCGNKPLNTYKDLVATVTPIKHTGSSQSKTFEFNNTSQTFKTPISGEYTFEVWGAQGGNTTLGSGTGVWYHNTSSCTYDYERHTTTTSDKCSYCGHTCGKLESWTPGNNEIIATGGKGGYSKGTLELEANQTLYIYVGGQGSNASYTTYTTVNGGYNGGGIGYYRAAGGGGATDIRLGGTGLLNRIIVAGGGGGATFINETYKANGGAGGGINGEDGKSTGNWAYYATKGGGQNNSMTWYHTSGCTYSGQYHETTSSSKCTACGHTCGYLATSSVNNLGTGGNYTTSYSAGGGGGYYGGQGGQYSGMSGAGGSGYTTGLTAASMQNGVRSGNGMAKITWNEVYYTGPSYVAPPIRYNHRFGSLDGTYTGILDTIITISKYYSEIPQTINGLLNPIFICKNIPNVHICTDECREIINLTCNEPHHYGQHYDYDNDICWDACGDDNNHKHSVKTPVTDAEGNVVYNGTFINLDNYFQVYFPNVGDFRGTNEYGIANTTINRGMGYIDNMSTLEWTREKKVMFGFDVLFKRNGVWEQHQAGEWISLPVKDSNGKELIYYDFYCLLSNKEQIATNVEFLVEAINCRPSPGGKESPYLGDDFVNADCIFDIYDGNVTNKDRSLSLEAYHSAYRMTYTDIVGRIGNLIIEDTEDLRFSNLFKQSTSEDKWIVEGILHEVDTSISSHYLSWFNNDGSFAKDIRGVTVSKETGMYNTYGTQEWTSKATALPLPLEAAKNVIPTLRTDQLKPGYNILFDISTIGEYRHKLQVIPYFFALNTDTNTLTPIDVYIKIDDEYKPINYFGLMSEYVQADNTYSDEYYTLKDKLYPYIMNLNWTKEALRRNYSNEEETITKYMGLNAWESVKDASGNVLTTKYLTIPFGENYALGTIQMLVPGARARTFIGSSKVNSVNINGSTETNINGTEPGIAFINNAQRWHLKLGLPSSVVYVPYRNRLHLEPTADVILPDGSSGKAYEEIEKGNYVILMTADIKAIGNTFVIGYDQGDNNGKITVDGKTYTFGNDIPTLIAIYDAKKNSTFDIDFIGTH